MNKYAGPSDWAPTGGLKLENAAQRAIYSKNNMLVIAGPGAGKTELLAQKTDYLFQTNICSHPRKILAISFKKDAAENLKERIVKRYGTEYASRFSSLTYDAFAKRILDHFRNALPENQSPQRDYLVADNKVLDKVFNKHVPGFTNMTNKQRNQLMDELLYINYNEEIWEDLLKGSENNRACLTFKMITILAISTIENNPKIKDALQATYSHIFLDEFQDTTDLQYSLVKTCFLNGDSVITAVGDNKQRIMEWAGARKNIFTDFQMDFSSDKTSLVMNYRSAPKLVDLQKKMYEALEENELNACSSERWCSREGEIKLFVSTDERDEAIKLVNDIFDKIQNGTSVNEMCILVKQKPENYSNEIIRLLGKEGIKARIENKFQDLLKQPIVLLILDIFKVSLRVQEPEEWGNLERFWLNSAGIDENSSIHEFDFAQSEIKKMINYCRSQFKNISNEQDLKIFIEKIVKFLNSERICMLYPEYKQGNYLEMVLDEFKKLFWKEYIDSDDFKKAINNFQGKNSIPIMTIHKSKGLEYEAVYFVGLEDSAFWNFKNQPVADRSAFFVAISRAKKYLSFSYCTNRLSLRNKFNQSGDQTNININEFFELLQQPGVAEIINQ